MFQKSPWSASVQSHYAMGHLTKTSTFLLLESALDLDSIGKDWEKHEIHLSPVLSLDFGLLWWWWWCCWWWWRRRRWPRWRQQSGLREKQTSQQLLQKPIAACFQSNITILVPLSYPSNNRLDIYMIHCLKIYKYWQRFYCATKVNLIWTLWIHSDYVY